MDWTVNYLVTRLDRIDFEACSFIIPDQQYKLLTDFCFPFLNRKGTP